jgi:protein O-GlcNAc transferase
MVVWCPVLWIPRPRKRRTESSPAARRITDAVSDPPDTEQTYVEQLLRLPGCFLCYSPMQDPPPVAPAPCTANGYTTFGSFNALAKITDEVIEVLSRSFAVTPVWQRSADVLLLFSNADVPPCWQVFTVVVFGQQRHVERVQTWCAILAAVPNSRLVLKNKPFACADTRALWLRRFRRAGLAAWRVDLLPLAAGTADHMAQYGLMDVSLDPWPYAGALRHDFRLPPGCSPSHQHRWHLASSSCRSVASSSCSSPCRRMWP